MRDGAKTSSPTDHKNDLTMKLATAALLIAPAVAFSPATNFGASRTALYMSTEAATETKVRFCDIFAMWESRRPSENPHCLQGFLLDSGH